MPIYEYYCPDNHTIYQFYAKTLRQGQTIPKCPANPIYRMKKLVSAFAIASGGTKGDQEPAADTPLVGAPDAARMDAAMSQMEKEFAHVDENDPRAMARMMRRMSELTGEKLDEVADAAVRKLEEGADPESLEELGGPDPAEADPDDELLRELGDPRNEPQQPRHRFRARRAAARRDPKLYDYE